MLHWDKNRKIDGHKRTPEQRFELGDDKFGIINFRSPPERKRPDTPACFCNESSLVWPDTAVDLIVYCNKLPALTMPALCDWAARSFVVVWINFAWPRLTGHAQNNSVTTYVTAQGSLFAWQGTSLVYFRLRFNLSSRQIKIVCGSFHGVHFCGRSLWIAYGLFKRTAIVMIVKNLFACW